MESAEFKNLLNRYLKNEVTEAERKLVDEWYETLNVQDERARQNNKPENDVDSNAKFLQVQPFAPVISFRKLYPYAAAVVIGMLSLLFLNKKGKLVSKLEAEALITYQTHTGELKKLLLPDGSVCWLNANSTVTISQNFQQGTLRRVNLLEGEAFFKVTKNPHKPFVVSAKHIQTRVLGTSFNVKAYSALHEAVVTVCTGKVQVNAGTKKLATLTPHQQIRYNPIHQTYTRHQVNNVDYQSWINGNIALNHVSFEELALVMLNSYGVTLKCSPHKAAAYRYTIHINTAHSFDETMRIICSVHQNTFKKNRNEISLF